MRLDSPLCSGCSRRVAEEASSPVVECHTSGGSNLSHEIVERHIFAYDRAQHMTDCAPHSPTPQAKG